MSKAIVILDKLPENCEDCPLCSLGAEEGHAKWKCQRTLKEVSLTDRHSPDWCPAHPLPHHARWEDPEDIPYTQGWNDCLTMILGNDAERRENDGYDE